MDGSMGTLFPWIFLTWACIHLLLFLARRRRSSLENLPPGPSPLPIIGSLHKLGQKPHHSLARLAEIYSPIISLRLGRVFTVVVSSAETAKQVLQTNDQALSGRTVADAVRAQRYCDSSMGWQPTDSNWRKLRTLSNTQIFTAQRLDSSQALRRRKVEELTAYVGQHSVEGRAVDVGRAPTTKPTQREGETQRQRKPMEGRQRKPEGETQREGARAGKTQREGDADC